MVREEISRDDAQQLFSAEDEPYKVELVDTAEGDISIYTQRATSPISAAGRTSQNSKPIKALKLTGLAGAYWRGDSTKPQLTRIYGTAFYSQEDLDAYLERLEQRGARPPPDRPAARPLPHVRVLARRGALDGEGDGDLQRARGPAPPREREARLPEVRRRSCGTSSSGSARATGRSTATNLFRIEHGDVGLRAQADELPRPHAPLQHAAPQLPRPADPLRRGRCRCTATSRPGACRADARAPVQPGRRARLLHGGPDPGGDRRDVRLRRLPLRRVRRARARARGARDAARQQARHRRAVGPHRGRAAAGARADRPALSRSPRAKAPSTGRRSTSSWTTRSAVRGRWGRSSSTASSRSGSAARTWAPTTASTRRTSSTARFRLARALHRDPARALRRRFAVLARAGAGAGSAGGGGAPRGGARPRSPAGPATASRSPSRAETIGKRIRAAELDKIPFTVVYGDRESDDEPRGARARRRAVDPLPGRASRQAPAPATL